MRIVGYPGDCTDANKFWEQILVWRCLDGSGNHASGS